MASVLKIGISSLLGAGAIGSAGYGIYEYSRETIENKLKGTLLTKQDSDTAKWKERTKTLKDDGSDLTTDLKKIKDKDNKETELQNWCDNNLKNKFSSETDKLFKEIEKYCTYNIKDKVGKVITETSWNSDTHNKKLSTFEEKEGKKLSETMKTVKQELTKQTPNKDALKNWCKDSYTKPYKGEQDQNFLDVKEYCKA